MNATETESGKETAVGGWVTNTLRTPRADEIRGLYDDPNAVRHYWEWRGKFTEGRPQATAAYTVEQLEEMGMIGLYRSEV